MLKNKIRKLSIDFDGTIATNFDPKDLLHLASRTNVPISHNYKYLDVFITFLGTFFQKEKKGLKNFLENIKNVEFYITTGRPNYIKKETENWITKNIGEGYFREIYYSKPGISPTQHKIDTIRNYELNGHIDDNPMVIEALAKEFPDKYFILLKNTHKKTIIEHESNVYHAKNWNKIFEIINEINK